MERKKSPEEKYAEDIAEAFALSYLQEKFGHDFFIGSQIENIIAENENVNIIYQYVEDVKYFGAAVSHESGEKFIAINSYHPLRIRYFTVAHELWHLTRGIMIQDKNFNHERAADRFAAAVMLPRTLTKDLWERYKKESGIEKTVISIADLAQVPYQSVIRRAKEIGIKFPSSLLKKTEEEWQVERIKLGFPSSNLDKAVKDTRFFAYEDVVVKGVEHYGLDTLTAASKLAKFAPQKAEQYQKILYVGDAEDES
ncbi:ImmA/IrrE family metallo-endopeptidase [Lysinibacillus fusiformis]|uniref:ImmA/IrrE family metallo-endopeptidase n=1 Tax=Lysinibacillus fusiformis TaxID=28031 RepID=UPI0021BF9801|nr:ImmA/IrrE family metallo-endopeptidase [Lysinibacillus fusiformis]UXJ71439.1 ImmA/IrrE family metallo-endopeptidase [Lysinibacillus fusiformis]